MKYKDAREIAIQMAAKIRSGQQAHASNLMMKRAVKEFFIPHLKMTKDNPQAYLTITTLFLVGFFGQLRVKNVCFMTVQNAIYKLQKQGYAPETIRKRVLLGKMFFNLLIQLNLAFQNPFENVSRPKVSNVLKVSMIKEESVAFVSVCRTINTVHAASILLMLFTGLRLSEALGIRKSDVNSNFTRLTLPKTKSGQVQVVALNSVSALLLKRMSENSWNDYVFPSAIKLHAPIAPPRNCMSAIKKEMKLLGFDISRITFHALRKTYATICAEETGGDLLMVAAQLRHSSPAILNRYVNYQSPQLTQVTESVAQALLGTNNTTKDIASNE